MAGKWFSGDNAKYFTIMADSECIVSGLDTPLTFCLPHSPACLDAVARMIEFAEVKLTRSKP
jgi:hypothetical protein